MQANFEIRRRVLVLTYRRYLEADQAWTAALREMRSWFPAGNRPYRWAIGNPGSPVRRAYERRERAILQLRTARLNLEEARRRLDPKRRRKDPSLAVMLAEFRR